MKSFVGKSPKRNSEQLGNSDCLIDQYSEYIIPLVENHVHAIVYRTSVSEIRPNTIYMCPDMTFRPRVNRTVNATFDESAPNVYPELIMHTNPESGTTREIFGTAWNEICQSGQEINCHELRINNRLAGYYIPNKNSWLVGHWTWHRHYIEIILAHVFPQFVELLGIGPNEHSIAAERSVKTVERITVSVGADPEFELIKDNEVINASTLGIRNSLSTDIGQDGSSSQIELRPRPGSPAAVTRNIKKLVSKFANQFPGYDLSDEGARYPLGGHIHVGLGYQVDVNPDLVKILDDFIGKPTINLSGDARGSYKSLGAWRKQPHGFEYRTTPASIFQDATMTYVTFRLIKNLCEKFFNQEEIKYSDKPTVQDYVTVGGLTDKQAKYFRSFCKGYKPAKSMLASWKINTKVEKVESPRPDVLRPRIEFRDEWRSAVADEVRTAISDMAWDGTISLYGLSRDRGSTGATISISGLNRIEGPRPLWTDDSHINIGITADIRRYGIPTRSVLNDLVRAIRAEIVTRMG